MKYNKEEYKAKNSKKSILITRMKGTDKKPIMPPQGNKKPTKKQIDTIARWIDEGAKFDKK